VIPPKGNPFPRDRIKEVPLPIKDTPLPDSEAAGGWSAELGTPQSALHQDVLAVSVTASW
jgi:hypothetical protein